MLKRKPRTRELPEVDRRPGREPALAIARFVRERRTENRLGQGELAELAGVGRRFVSDLEGAKSTVRLDAVDAVLQVFGKTLGIVDARREQQDPGLEDEA